MPDPEDPNDLEGWTKNKDGRWHHPYTKEFKGIPNKPNVQNTKLQKALKDIYRKKMNSLEVLQVC